MKIVWQCSDCDGWFEGINANNPMTTSLCNPCLSARWVKAWHGLCNLLESKPEIKRHFDAVCGAERITALHLGGRTLTIGEKSDD